MKQLPQIISLRLNTSLCIAGFLCIVHLLASVAIFLSDIPEWLRWLLLAAILFSGYILWRRFIIRNLDDAILQAEWLADDSWRILDGAGRTQQVTSWATLLNTPALIMLNFKLADKKSATLVICPDSVDAEIRRQLRVRLNVA